MGEVKAISVSAKKGVKKRNVESAVLKEGFGIVGDAHAGTENRQISMLAEESIKKIRDKGLMVAPGDFAENITISGIDLMKLDIGAKVKIGQHVLLEISQKGKKCHSRCSIYYKVGDCVMPREGIFARVLKGGIINKGDVVKIVT